MSRPANGPNELDNTVSLEDIWGPLTPAQELDLKASQLLWREQADQDEAERARLLREIEHERRKNQF